MVSDEQDIDMIPILETIPVIDLLSAVASGFALGLAASRSGVSG